jgi:hypothetical protein
VSTVVVHSVNSIDIYNRRPLQFMAALLVAVGFHLRLGIRTIGDQLERRFAGFAGVPYLNPLRRQQWEELWETEANTSNSGLRLLGRLSNGTIDDPAWNRQGDYRTRSGGTFD